MSQIEYEIGLYHHIFICCTVISGICLTVACILAVILKIPRVFDQLTGRNVKTAVKFIVKGIILFVILGGAILLGAQTVSVFAASVTQQEVGDIKIGESQMEYGEKTQSKIIFDPNNVHNVVYSGTHVDGYEPLFFRARIVQDDKMQDSQTVAAQITDPARWCVSVSGTKTVLNSVSVQFYSAEMSVETPGMYMVTGGIVYAAQDVGTAQICLSYDNFCEAEALNVKIQADWSLTVEPKEINIALDTIQYEEKCYDGSPAIQLKTIGLNGLVNSDSVYIDTDKPFILMSADVCKEGSVLNLNEAEGGRCPVLTGADAAKYILNLDNLYDYRLTCITKERPIRVNLGDVVRDYYASNPDFQKIAVQNCESVFTGIVDQERDIVLNTLLSQYMPVFTTEAMRTEGTGRYDITAAVPRGDKPKQLHNYCYDFQADETACVGSLIISPRPVEPWEYELAEGFTVKSPQKEAEMEIWASPESQGPPVLCAKDPCSGYTDLYFYEDAQCTRQVRTFAFTKNTCLWFRLVFIRDGEVTAQSQAVKLTCCIDRDTHAYINVSANGQCTGFEDQLAHEPDLNIFGNQKNVQVTVGARDHQSGVYAVQYLVMDYDEFQFLSRDQMKSFLERQNQWISVLDANEKKIDIDEKRQIIFVKAIDLVGNVSYASTEGIVVDGQAPAHPVLTVKDPVKNHIYNKDVEILFDTSDVYEHSDCFSGIEQVKFQCFLKSEKGLQEAWSKVIAGAVKNNLKTSQLKENAEKFRGSLVIPYKVLAPQTSDQSFHVTVLVTVRDYGGNESEGSIEFDYDFQVPDVTVTFDGQVENGFYFNTKRLVTIEVSDPSFTPEGVEFHCTGPEPVPASEEKGGWNYADGWKNTAPGVYIMKFYFCTDGIYTFGLCVTDLAGNQCSLDEQLKDHEKYFVVDSTAPRIIEAEFYSVSQDKKSDRKLPSMKDQRYYSNEKICGKIIIQDRNFCHELMSESGSCGLKICTNACDNTGAALEPGWKHQWHHISDDLYMAEILFSDEANYTFSIVYKDLAGNDLSHPYRPDHFTLDWTKPNGCMGIDKEEVLWDGSVSLDNERLFFNRNIQVSFMRTDDFISGIEQMVMMESKNLLTEAQLDLAFAQGLWSEIQTIQLEADQSVIIYGRIEDCCGNYTYIRTPMLILDSHVPDSRIDILTPKPVYDIYSGNVNVEISAWDGDTAVENKRADASHTANGLEMTDGISGLSSVYYEIRNNQKVTQKGFLLKPGEKEKLRYTKEQIQIDGSLNNSNDIQIYVCMKDKAGNFSEKVKNILIDCTKPQIRVSFDSQLPKNNWYFKDVRTATVEIREQNFRPDLVKIDVNSSNGMKPVMTQWTAGEKEGQSQIPDVYSCRIIFQDNGEYDFSVYCKDMALNEAVIPYKSERLIIDRQAPVIDICYDHHSSQSHSYYNHARTATITVHEHYFDSNDVKIHVVSSLGGRYADAPECTPWTDNGDVHTTSITFNNEGDYILKISYEDLAGNPSNSIEPQYFTLDFTAPKIEFKNIADQSANRGSVAPMIVISDLNFLPECMAVRLTGAGRGYIPVEQMISRVNGLGQTQITFKDFDQDMDDLYTLTASAADQAGNRTVSHITFSVNRHGSTYVMDGPTRKRLDSGFINTPSDMIIHEINVDSLEFIELTCSVNGEVKKMIPDRDYTVKMENDQGKWKKYTYTIAAACFETQGTYCINIYSRDRADNVNMNQMKGKPIEFIIDHTPPVISVSNLEDRGRYKEKLHEFTVQIKDYTVLDKAVVDIDGVKTVYTGADLEQPVRISMKAQNQYQHIRITAWDMAGNKNETKEVTVLVTPSSWILFFMNKPLFYLTLMTALAIIGGIVFIGVKLWRVGIIRK